MEAAPSPQSLKAGSRIELREGELVWRIDREAAQPGNALFLAAALEEAGIAFGGSCVIPWGRYGNGSTLQLGFRANHHLRLSFDAAAPPSLHALRWERYGWRDAAAPRLREEGGGGWSCALPLPAALRQVRFLTYRKQWQANDGWGELVAPRAENPEPVGDQFIAAFFEQKPGEDHPRPGTRAGRERIRIYQLFPRLFGNATAQPVPWGTLRENGCGRFNDLHSNVLESLRDMGFTHLWLTGILRHATGTAHPGLPADPPDLLKGIAGSPYALKDPFDLCPDYASRPEARFEEFRALRDRIHAAGLRLLIDFIPNHLARSFAFGRCPEHEPGARGRGGRGDDPGVFFDPDNNFYYLQPGPDGPPLRLPPVPPALAERLGPDRYQGEATFGRVTGNNVARWNPGPQDWYETVKLNYGFDFITGQVAHPHWGRPDAAIPDTWWKMDALLAHWQEEGVDGFRCDMAHLIPPEFWQWALARARHRRRETLFIAEAYDDDPSGVPSRNPLLASLNNVNDGRSRASTNLLDAGFDAVYEGAARRTLKRIYDGPGWANDLAPADPFTEAGAVRYAENHDEVRLAAPGEWGNVGQEVGRPVSALLYSLSGGPILVYNGQETGEGDRPGSASGYGGQGSRTSLFDYGTMPGVLRWLQSLHGGTMDRNTGALRAYYRRLLRLMGEPAFLHGRLEWLNPANAASPGFGRLPGESTGGHWMAAFLRHAPDHGQCFLVVVNLHPKKAFRDVALALPAPVLRRAGLDSTLPVTLTDRLAATHPLRLRSLPGTIGLAVIPPLSAYCFELTSAS